MKTILHSASETHEWGKSFAQSLKSGDIVALHGQLGAGKTTLTQGIARGLGITQTITSPSFTIINTYPLNDTTKHFIHIDTYRQNTREELLSIGIQEFISDPNNITVIEWPEILEDLLPHHTKHLYLEQKNSMLYIEFS